MSQLVVETVGLRKQYGAQTAVASLTLSIRQGEVFGFLGPNGAGKTTSIKMLLGLVKPTGGQARVLGAPLNNVQARARIGFLPEHFRFQEWLTAREFLAFHGRLYGMSHSALAGRIGEVLERVDLHDASERRLREFSKGMLQRVGLAQALLNRPALVFLDEPTSGLDPLGRRLVREVLNELREQGTTVFLNSHILSEVEITCDRVAFVKRGVVVREMALHAGDTGEVTVELRAAPLSAALLAGLAQFGREVTVDDGTVRMRADGEARLPEIARWVVEQGASLYRLALSQPSLEEQFLAVMGSAERPG